MQKKATNETCHTITLHYNHFTFSVWEPIAVVLAMLHVLKAAWLPSKEVIFVLNNDYWRLIKNPLW